MRRSNAASVATLVLALVAGLAVSSAALADKKKPKSSTDTPKETLSLSYGEIKWDYTAQNPRQNTNHPTPKTSVGGAMRR